MNLLDYAESQECRQAVRQRSIDRLRAAVPMPTEAIVRRALRGLSEDRAAKVAKQLNGLPDLARRTYARAVGGRNIQAAVRAQCYECMGWECRRVASCDSLACPLWPYRPGRKAVQS